MPEELSCLAEFPGFELPPEWPSLVEALRALCVSNPPHEPPIERLRGDSSARGPRGPFKKPKEEMLVPEDEDPWIHLAQASVEGIFPDEANRSPWKLPEDVKQAIFHSSKMQEGAVLWRNKRLQSIAAIRRRLRPVNTELERLFPRPTHVKQVCRADVALWACIIDAFWWQDKTLPRDLHLGFSLEGDIQRSGTFRKTKESMTCAALAALHAQQLLDNRQYTNDLEARLALHAEKAPPGSEQFQFLEHVERITRGEARDRVAEEPFDRAELERRFARKDGHLGCTPHPRFVIAQGLDADGQPKLRAIDDAKFSGANARTRTEETISLPSYEFALHAAREFADVGAENGHGRQELHLGLEDVAAAYRQCGVSDTSQSVVAFWSTTAVQVPFCVIWGMLFGCIASFLNWNRCSVLMASAAARLLAAPVVSYFDDFMLMLLALAGDSAQVSMRALFTLLGMPVKTLKTKKGATLNRALGMMCDLREWVLEGAVSFFPPGDKMVALDCCPPVLAREITGKLAWMLLGVAGRLGRSALQPFIERASETGRQQHWALNEPMREAINFYNALLAPAALAPRRCRIATRFYTHVLLYTDASTRGLGLEMVAFLFGILTYADCLKGRKVLFFVDNTTAISAVVHGYSRKADLAVLANLCCLLLVGLGVIPWIEYVPTDANGSDIPSRVEKRDQSELVRHSFRPRPLRAVSRAQWATPSLLLSTALAIAEEQRAKFGA
ncbi:hypothetical protein T484DRAFT_1797917 [Baffinella frigidus]|nr:hypothetical protein T484DRAFT_1797917 [Cryptophyta sp. CCMP2293]